MQDSTQDEGRKDEALLVRIASKTKRTIESIFVTAWAYYMQQYEDNKLALQLKQLNANQAVMNSTKKAKSDLNNEESVEPGKISELVAKTTKKETKRLQQDVANLTAQMNQLKDILKKILGNASPVQHNKRTKTPQKNQQKQRNQNQRKNRNGNSAAGKNNALRSKNGNKNNKNGQKQSKNKNNWSNLKQTKL